MPLKFDYEFVHNFSKKYIQYPNLVLRFFYFINWGVQFNNLYVILFVIDYSNVISSKITLFLHFYHFFSIWNVNIIKLLNCNSTINIFFNQSIVEFTLYMHLPNVFTNNSIKQMLVFYISMNEDQLNAMYLYYNLFI